MCIKYYYINSQVGTILIPRCRWKDNITIIFEKLRARKWGGFNRFRDFREEGDKSSTSIYALNFLDYLLLKTLSTLWS
jgi:hypothetical protein